MIRRDGGSDPATRGHWVLISQIDHARLSGNLAEHWGGDGFLPLKPREELLWAIYHHDDGWRQWEQEPGVLDNGQPRAFTEMQASESLAIWIGSIEMAQTRGNLAAYVVAGHFCALARRATAWKKHRAQWAAVEQFLARFETQMTHWQETWHAEDPALNTPACAQEALSQLQFFDRLSLWFCCTPSGSQERLETPRGPVLTVAPIDWTHVRLSPWPLTCDCLEVELPGRLVAQGRYRSAAELAASASQCVVVSWSLRRWAEKVDAPT
jgi:hypothetical protein